MSSRTLPADARARLTQILANVEQSLIALEGRSQARDVQPFATGFTMTNPTAGEPLRLALTAAAEIMEVIAALEQPATARRQAVEHWHDQVRQLCGIDRASFIAARRRQARWLTFQEQLQQPDRVDRAPRKQPRSDRRSFQRQLAAYMHEVNWDDDDLAAATKQHDRTIDARTVERHRTGKQRPSRKSILAYQKALSVIRGSTQFNFPKSKRSRWK